MNIIAPTAEIRPRIGQTTTSQRRAASPVSVGADNYGGSVNQTNAPGFSSTKTLSGLSELSPLTEDRLLGVVQGPNGKEGLGIRYDADDILRVLARSNSNPSAAGTLIQDLPKALALIQSDIIVPIFSIDRNGNVSDTSMTDGGGNAIGSSNDAMSYLSGSDLFNGVSRAAEGLNAALTKLGIDPSSMGDSESVDPNSINVPTNGSTSDSNLDNAREFLRKNPEVLLALLKLSRGIEIINKKKKQKADQGERIVGTLSSKLGELSTPEVEPKKGTN